MQEDQRRQRNVNNEAIQRCRSILWNPTAKTKGNAEQETQNEQGEVFHGLLPLICGDNGHKKLPYKNRAIPAPSRGKRSCNATVPLRLGMRPTEVGSPRANQPFWLPATNAGLRSEKASFPAET